MKLTEYSFIVRDRIDIMDKIKVMSIFGTRPEAIKMCPLIRKMQEHREIESVVCLTGQHKEMLQQVIDIFQIQVDYNLQIMKPSQTLTWLLSINRFLSGMLRRGLGHMISMRHIRRK